MLLDLSDRDIVFLIALAAVTTFALSRAGARAMVASILGTLRPFVLVVLGFTAYFVALVAAAQQLGLWNPSLVKDTIAWFIVGGLTLLFRFPKTYEDRRFYRRTALRVIGITSLVEFFISLSSFAFLVELLLLPTVVLLGLFSAVAALKPETRNVKSIADALSAIIGILVIVGTGVVLVGEWPSLDKTKLGLSLLLPVWATIGCLPFVFLFGLYANYESKFMQINLAAPHDQRARRRAKAALVLSFHLRNRALHTFDGLDARELTRATSWDEARRVIAYQRAMARVRVAKENLAAERLIRYAGVEGTDGTGQQLDQREFEATKHALNRLAMFHRAQYEMHGQYRADLMDALGNLVSEKLPSDPGIVMKVKKSGRLWFASRRTVTGWCFGIGAAGPPPDQWVYEGPEPPAGFPRGGGGWKRGDFDEGSEEE